MLKKRSKIAHKYEPFGQDSALWKATNKCKLFLRRKAVKPVRKKEQKKKTREKNVVRVDDVVVGKNIVADQGGVCGAGISIPEDFCSVFYLFILSPFFFPCIRVSK